MLAEGGAALAYIYRYIQHRALDHADQFALGMRRATESAGRAARLDWN